MHFAQPPPPQYAAEMRFFLKWLLAGMAYAALAAMAIRRGDAPYVDSLAVVVYFSMIYAALRSALAPSGQKGPALGFAVGSVTCALMYNFGPILLPLFIFEVVESNVARRAVMLAAAATAGLIGSALGALAARRTKVPE